MTIKIKRFELVQDNSEVPVDPALEIFGRSWIRNLNIRLEIDASEGFTAADPFQVRIMTREPTRKERGNGSMSSPLMVPLDLDAKTGVFKATVPLDKLAIARDMPDQVPEVATVVRDGGTSDAIFRSTLEGKGWQLRGAAVQPAKGQPNWTPDLIHERPDASLLFAAGGVELLELTLVKPSDKSFAKVVMPSTWVFLSNPADIFFYSGHGAWGTGSLLREQGDHQYEEWLTPDEVFQQWRNHSSDPKVHTNDLDVLIINGCSVLFWNRFNETVDDPARKSWGLEWAKLLSTRQGPLSSILGYRTVAPLDRDGGYDVAKKFADRIVGGLGVNFDNYAKAWLEVNLENSNTLTACAIDNAGYWYINVKPKPAKKDAIDVRGLGYDSKERENAILGPIPLP
jgi:hypothetical protein